MSEKLNSVDIADVLDAVFQLPDPVTLLGIGPMSATIVEASIELAQELDFPLFFIASRNQIESKSLGGGYVENWNQTEFSQFVDKIAEAKQFTGIVCKCRDHGGPWQRDSDFAAGLPENIAFRNAYSSYGDDLNAGFQFLHVDTSKDPAYNNITPANLAVERVAQIVRALENIRRTTGLVSVVYEASLEETNGDFSVVKEFSHFVALLKAELEKASLPLPKFIVGNTGTLTKMDRNIGKFDKQTIKALSKIALKNGMILKEHNADYLATELLQLHPALGIGMANVAPEFGKIETDSLLELCEMENRLFEIHSPEFISPSRFNEILLSKVRWSGKWKKWLTQAQKSKEAEELFSDPQKAHTMVCVNGHYFFSDPEVIAARESLFHNISILHNHSIDPQDFVKTKIKHGIRRYVVSFNMVNLTGKIKKVLEVHERPSLGHKRKAQFKEFS